MYTIFLQNNKVSETIIIIVWSAAQNKLSSLYLYFGLVQKEFGNVSQFEFIHLGISHKLEDLDRHINCVSKGITDTKSTKIIEQNRKSLKQNFITLLMKERPMKILVVFSFTFTFELVG